MLDFDIDTFQITWFRWGLGGGCLERGEKERTCEIVLFLFA